MKKRVLLLVLAVLALSLVLVSCGHKHEFQATDEVITEATCSTAGKVKYACECGETEEREIPAKGHTYGEPKVIAPTCWDDGYTYQICTVCEAESEHTDVKKAGADYHKFDEVKYTTPVDCSKAQDGIKETVCSICGTVDPNGSPEVERYQHDNEEKREEATCSKEGSIKQVCKKCGAVSNDTPIPKLPHTEEVTESSPATCDKDGYEKYKCTVCEETWEKKTADSTGHQWLEELQVMEATCLMPGYYYKKCSACGEEEKQPGEVGDGLPLGHLVDYNDASTVIVDPTCITAGSKTPYCLREDCGEYLDVELDLNGDSYVQTIDPTYEHYVKKEEISSNSASCHEAAYIEYKCTTDDNCTETKKEYNGNKLEHDYKHVGDVQGTCSKEGYEIWVCQNCIIDKTVDSTCELCVEHRNKYTTDHAKTTNVTKDKDGNPVDFIPATCSKQAYQIWECANCPASENKWTYYFPVTEKPLIVHDPSIAENWVSNGEKELPTCESEGYSIYVCNLDDDCSETIKKDYVRRTGHEFKVYIDGRFKCKKCKVTYRDTSTFVNEALGSGDLVIDKDTTLSWELKGYDKPKNPTMFNGSYEYVLNQKDNAETPDVDETTQNISNGLIILHSESDNVTYTVTVKYMDGEEEKTATFTNDMAIKAVIDGEDCVYFDLYAGSKIAYVNGNLVSVEITATANDAPADAVVIFCTNEGISAN